MITAKIKDIGAGYMLLAPASQPSYQEFRVAVTRALCSTDQAIADATWKKAMQRSPYTSRSVGGRKVLVAREAAPAETIATAAAFAVGEQL